jgi:hypothetical protein
MGCGLLRFAQQQLPERLRLRLLELQRRLPVLRQRLELLLRLPVRRRPERLLPVRQRRLVPRPGPMLP